MASSCQFQRLLPLLPLVGVGVGAIITIYFPVSRKRCSTMFHKSSTMFQKMEKEHTTPKKDYINRLSDDILCHIISYLGTEDAIRTSVLSRRWTKLYCTLPNPKFECHEMYKHRFVTVVHKMFEFVTTNNSNCRCYKQRFVTAVDNFLHLRSGLPMKSFTLRFCLMRKFPVHLRRWLNCIVSSGVRKLDLYFCCNDELLKIPDSELTEFPFKVLLSACTLEYVRLSFCILEPNFQGPSNSLKELTLCFVPLVNGEVESILSSCPQLTLLILRHCKLPCKLIVNALELRTLRIVSCEQVNEIGLSAPNLNTFLYYCNNALSFFPSYVPNLRRLILDLESLDRPHGFGGFVRGVPCLHTLFIEASAYQVRYIQPELPTLWDLRAVCLHVMKGSLDLRDIISLIAVCPNLSMFEFSSLGSLSYTERDAEKPPKCVHLELVVLDGFKFDAPQKKFASQLLRCAPALKQMSIYTAYCLHKPGETMEQTLPLDRRVFPPELISRTKLQLEQQAYSSSTIVNFSCSNNGQFLI